MQLERPHPSLALGLLLAGCVPEAPECPDPETAPAVVPASAPAPKAPLPAESESQAAYDLDADPGLVIPVPGGAPICLPDAIDGSKKDGLAGLREAIDRAKTHDWSQYETPPVAVVASSNTWSATSST